MTQLPTNRTAANSIQEHVDDHNTLATEHNELDGHAADTTAVHGITDTAGLYLAASHTKAAHDALTLSHDSLSDVSANDHHAQLHAAAHATGQADAIAPSDIGASATGHAHSGTYEPAGTVATHAAAADPHTGYVLESLLDAAGDLITATANDTPSKLSMGSALQVLRVNAGATALEYATASSGPAPLFYDQGLIR